jgi:hypothetical protein
VKPLASEGASEGAELGVQLQVDGVRIPDAAASSRLRVNPGPHAIVVVATDGRRVERDLVLTERGAQSLEIELPPLLAPSPAQRAPEKTRLPTAPVRASSSGYPFAYGSFIAGGVAVVAGAATGVGVLVEASALRQDCPHGPCAPPHQGELGVARGLATTSDVAFGLAIVAVAAGVIDLFIERRRHEAPRTTLRPWTATVAF